MVYTKIIPHFKVQSVRNASIAILSFRFVEKTKCIRERSIRFAYILVKIVQISNFYPLELVVSRRRII